MFTSDATAVFQKIDLSKLLKYRALEIYFDAQEPYDSVINLLRLNCPEKDCPYSVVSNAIGELKQHVSSAHKKVFCDVCVKHKKAFSSEQKLFNQIQLYNHKRDGDGDPAFKGHPACGFCTTSFYTNDELYTHCTERHEQCFLCQADGKMHLYFKNYAQLVNKQTNILKL